MTRRFRPRLVLAPVVLVIVSLAGAARADVVPPAPPGPSVANSPGWLGSRSAQVAQDAVATINVRSSWASANLLVAFVATDGPDTAPVAHVTTETTAVFGGTAALHWTRVAHVAARQDWAAPGDRLEPLGASVVEVWTAAPGSDWSAGGAITVTTTHPNTRDDGMAVTIVAFSNGTLDHVVRFDGLAGMREQAAVAVPPHSAIYAATFAGKRNANFVPLAGYHRVVQRRAGDDTAAVIASNDRDLASGTQAVGYGSPDPGNYWEAAAAVITSAG